MDILLLRHGEAADATGPDFADEARALTKRGRDELAAACGTYAQVVPQPQLLLHSPLLRARQSAELLSAALDAHQKTASTTEECRDLTPASRPGRILERLHGEALAGTRSVALIGHEPHLGNLYGLLLTGSEQHPMPLQKGMLVWVGLDSAQTMLARARLCLHPSDAARLARS